MVKNLFSKFKTAGQDIDKNPPQGKFALSQQQKKIILIGIGIVVLLYVDCAFILKAQFKSSGAILSKVLKVRSGLAQYRKDFIGCAKLKTDLAALRERAAGLKSNIISDSDLPIFLDNLSQKANVYSIKIMQIKPMREDIDKDKNAQGAAGGGLQLYGLPINMQLRAGYHKLGEFISSLESNPLVELVNLKIYRDSANPAYQSVDLNLKAYVTK